MTCGGLTAKRVAFGVCFSILLLAASSLAHPIRVTDALGRRVEIRQPPARVVCLVPAVSEMLLAIGAGEAVIGITHHDEDLAWPGPKTIVGGFAAPDPKRIVSLAPDLLIVASMHQAVKERFRAGEVVLFEPEIGSLPALFENLSILGEMFGRQAAAAEVSAGIRAQFELAARKTAAIPTAARKRVMRVMGAEPLLAPGDDSFQNELIRAAGGIAPRFGRDGQVIEVNLEEWLRFDPEVVYACGDEQEAVRARLQRPGWREAAAVKEERIYFFPCDLTCRASVHAGDFVQQLSARLYPEVVERERQLAPDRILGSEELPLGLSYVSAARVVASTSRDHPSKTLVLDFTAPMNVLSTLEGTRAGITTIGNHSLPPPLWLQAGDLPGLRADLARVLDRAPASSAFLFTGAALDNLAVREKSFREMRVHALVTAGVKGNAMRMGRDTGGFYEPGTINILLLTNRRLTPQAMSRAIITATEAKSAALAALDIRSSFTPLLHQATGTGTDNLIVVEGAGAPLDLTGGHTKMGELIAGAVYEAVQEAVARQNGLRAGRSVLGRLAERRLDLYRLLTEAGSRCGAMGERLTAAMERLLLDPRYAGYLEAALAASDEANGSSHAFSLGGRAVAAEIAGRPVPEVKECVEPGELPAPLAAALNVLVNGLVGRDNQ